MARQMAAANCKRPGSSGTARRRSPRSRRTGPSLPDAGRAAASKLIETNTNIGLIERPEYKRRWIREPWDDQVQRAFGLAARPPGDRALLARRGQLARTDQLHAAGRRAPATTPSSSRWRPLRGRPDFDAAELVDRTGRGRVGPVPARPALQALGPAQAGGLGADLGPPAPARTPARTSGDDPRAAQVHLGRLPQVRLLAAAGQARRAQGAVRQLPALRDATATRRWSSAGPAGTTSSRRRPWPPTTTGCKTAKAGTPSASRPCWPGSTSSLPWLTSGTPRSTPSST